MKAKRPQRKAKPFAYPVSVQALAPYKLRVLFADGLEATIDLSQDLEGPFFDPLKTDPTLWSKAEIRAFTIYWDLDRGEDRIRGIDIAPEYLYKMALKANGWRK